MTDLLDQSCSAESACTGDEGDYSMNECIEMIDGFNNSFDTLDPYGVFMHPGPADPKVCQDAKNNAVVIQ